MPRSLGRPLVCVVTDDAGRADDLVNFAASASAASVDFFQIRERRLKDTELLVLARQAVTLTRATATAVLVNERLDVAHAAGADGVHLRGESAPAARVRATAPDGFLIGRSVHSAGEAAAAEAAGGLDYLIFGT
ncbi:MAG TPA: thiamine phosphate synthase, partial [Vicinamibacterales bacterium]|nr:thiamine phosphate synthase [Vicinamibacterales bacterium]